MSTHNIPNPSAEEKQLAKSAPVNNIEDELQKWRPRFAKRDEPILATVARYARRIMGSDGEAHDITEIQPQPGTPTLATYAAGVLTGTTIANNNTVTIGSTTYTFKTALSSGPTVANEVLVGASDSDSLDNLVAAVNGAAGVGTTYSTGTVANTLAEAAAGAGDTVDITALTLGTSGNSVATTATLSAGGFAAATLTGATFATPARAGKRLYDSSFLYIAIADVITTSTTGWRKISHAAL